MSSANKPKETSLLKKFTTLNEQLITCTNDLQKMNENPLIIDEIEFKEDKINSDLQLKEDQLNCEIPLNNLQSGLKDDLINLQKLDDYLQKECKKKDKIEQKHKNLRILNTVYEDIYVNNLNKLHDGFSNPNFGINKAEEKIGNETNTLYQDIEDELESRLTLNRNNYMKSSTDTVLETVKNLLDTLQSSYAFHALKHRVGNLFPS